MSEWMERRGRELSKGERKEGENVLSKGVTGDEEYIKVRQKTRRKEGGKEGRSKGNIKGKKEERST